MGGETLMFVCILTVIGAVAEIPTWEEKCPCSKYKFSHAHSKQIKKKKRIAPAHVFSHGKKD